jgi:hypothetical protein
LLRLAAARGESTGGHGGGRLEEGIDIPGGVKFEAKVVAFVAEEAEFAFEFVAAADVGDVATLEGGEVGVELWWEREDGVGVRIYALGDGAQDVNSWCERKGRRGEMDRPSP